MYVPEHGGAATLETRGRKVGGGLTVAVVVAAVATKEDAQVVHTGEATAPASPLAKSWMKTGERPTLLRAILQPPRMDFSLSLCLSLSRIPADNFSLFSRASSSRAVFCPRSGKGDSLLCPSLHRCVADCRAQRRARVVCTTVWMTSLDLRGLFRHLSIPSRPMNYSNC